ETADRLARQFNAKVVIVGARGEEALAQSIAQQIRAKTVVLSGQTTVRELLAVVKRCATFLTNDTGPMHVATAFGVPVVAVFGPTDWRTTAPSGAGHALIRQPVDCAPCLLRECPIDHRCMTRVTVDEVYQAAVVQMVGGTTAALEAPRLPLHGVTVLLDRDGTTNRDTGYIKTVDELQIFPGAVDAVARLKWPARAWS
ncbi:MAG: glycosyltransferase family 9 protein, partial [Nitrospira sp.]